MDHADGASPRFGSCYLLVRGHMTPRCTLTWGDSHEDPEHVGTIELIDALLAALLQTSEMTGEALGTSGMDVGTLLQFLAARHRRDPSQGVIGRALDTYIEAQVHADLELEGDVEALVIDPAFGGTEVGDRLRELCVRYGTTFQEHPGFVLGTKDVPGDFRGPRMVPLAARLDHRFATTPGTLDAVVIGRAAESLHLEPGAWQDWGPHDRYGHARGQNVQPTPTI